MFAFYIEKKHSIQVRFPPEHFFLFEVYMVLLEHRTNKNTTAILFCDICAYGESTTLHIYINSKMFSSELEGL